MYNRFTGVHESARGSGVVSAFKYLIFHNTKQQGIFKLRTNNSSKNEPILAINRKAGYQPKLGMFIIKKTFEW